MISEKREASKTVRASKEIAKEILAEIKEAEVEIEAWDGRLEAKQAGEQYAPPSPKRKSNAKGKGKNSKGKNKKKNKTCSKEDSNDESDDDISDTDEEEDSNFAVLTDEEEAEETPKKKRKTSGSDSEADSDVQIEEDSDDDENEEDISNDMTEDEIKSTLKEKKAVAKESRKKKKDRKAETDSCHSHRQKACQASKGEVSNDTLELPLRRTSAQDCESWTMSELKSRWALPGIPTSRSAITMRSTFQCSAAVLANMLRSLVWLQEMAKLRCSRP